MKTFKWRKGDKAKIARKAGILPCNLSLILSGRRSVSVKMACRLEKASGYVLKKPIPLTSWIFNKKGVITRKRK